MIEKTIGEKIRLIRANREITLKDLAKKTGFTEGYLSRIENSDTAPPISTLGRIAQGLDIDVSYLLLSEIAKDADNPSVVLFKAKDIGESGFLETPHRRPVHGYQYQPIATEKRGKNMEPYILIPDFEPGESLQHEGEEFLCILEGAIEFLYGTEKYFLEKGDCLYFDSNIPHNGKSLGERRAKVLIILQKGMG